MLQDENVVYVARTVQDAHFLKNLLADSDIKAVVTNATLAGGAGVDVVGWATQPRVVVAPGDFAEARLIALEFDRHGAAALAGAEVELGVEHEVEVDQVAPEARHDWPQCPECHRPRLTRCKVCDTAGTDFKLADMGFEWIPGVEAPAAAGACCGPGGCAPAGAGGEDASAQQEDAAGRQDPSERPVLLLVCPTCDEPFEPEYLRTCEWCGHEFETGYQAEAPAAPVEQIDSRVIAVIAGLLALGVALVAYFLFLV